MGVRVYSVFKNSKSCVFFVCICPSVCILYFGFEMAQDTTCPTTRRPTNSLEDILAVLLPSSQTTSNHIRQASSFRLRLSSSPERVMGSGPLPDGEAARMLAPEPSCVPLLLPLAGWRGFAFTDACPPLPCSSTQHPNASKSGIRSRDENEMIEAGLSGDFPGGPLVMNLPWHAEAAGSVPGWGTKIPHAVGQQSPNTISAEPICHN